MTTKTTFGLNPLRQGIMILTRKIKTKVMRFIMNLGATSIAKWTIMSAVPIKNPSSYFSGLLRFKMRYYNGISEVTIFVIDIR